MFTARYALSPYITQIRVVFKGLNCTRKIQFLPDSQQIPSPVSVKDELVFSRVLIVSSENLTVRIQSAVKTNNFYVLQNGTYTRVSQ